MNYNKQMKFNVLFYCLAPSIVFVAAFYRELIVLNFSNIAFVTGGTFTAMIAITALLYARAQALPLSNTKDQCLSGAERCFKGTMFFATLFIVVALIMTALSFFPNYLVLLDPVDLFLYTFFVPILAVKCFYDFMSGINVAAASLFSNESTSNDKTDDVRSPPFR